MMNATTTCPSKTATRKPLTVAQPILPKRCPLAPSTRVPVTPENRSLLRLLRQAEWEAWNTSITE